MLVDLVVHGWDVARGAGVVFDPPADGKLLPSRELKVGDKVRARLVDTNVTRGFIDFEQID